jgi:hypothetical protein
MKENRKRNGLWKMYIPTERPHGKSQEKGEKKGFYNAPVFSSYVSRISITI